MIDNIFISLRNMFYVDEQAKRRAWIIKQNIELAEQLESVGMYQLAAVVRRDVEMMGYDL